LSILFDLLINGILFYEIIEVCGKLTSDFIPDIVNYS